MMHKMIYRSMPGKAAEKQVRITYPTRTSVGSISKKSAMPPHTPASMVFDDFVSRLYMMSAFHYVSVFNAKNAGCQNSERFIGVAIIR